MAVVPSQNVTVPVTVPPAVVPAGGCTVAVKVTLWPTTAGLTADATEVEVAAGFTVSISTGEVLAAKFVSPLYFAVMECEPAASEETGNWAEPPERVALPKDVEPSKNEMEPVAPL